MASSSHVQACCQWHRSQLEFLAGLPWHLENCRDPFLAREPSQRHPGQVGAVPPGDAGEDGSVGQFAPAERGVGGQHRVRWPRTTSNRSCGRPRWYSTCTRAGGMPNSRARRRAPGGKFDTPTARASPALRNCPRASSVRSRYCRGRPVDQALGTDRKCPDGRASLRAPRSAHPTPSGLPSLAGEEDLRAARRTPAAPTSCPLPYISTVSRWR